MKKYLFCSLFLLIFLFVLSSCGGETTDMTLTASGEVHSIQTHNGLSSAALFDRGYAPDGVPSPVYKAPSDGAVFIWYRQGGEEIKASVSVEEGETCVIPTNGCSIFIKGASPNDDFTADGFVLPEYIDLIESPSVTDKTGVAGFVLTHKDPVGFENVVNALFSASPANRVPVPAGYIALTCTRNAKGEFSTKKFDVEKTAEREFTLMMSDPYAIGFAKALMKEKNTYLLNNTDKISAYGTEKTVVMGSTPFTVHSINPASVSEGVHIYDEGYGLSLTPERDFDFVDVFVFDGIVTFVGEKNVRTVLPYPSGYCVSFNGKDAVKSAENIKAGDKAECLLFEPAVTPANYVLLNGERMVETLFRNENRTEFATAVIYDGKFFWDSTRTNIWGVEAAFDSDGKLVSVTDMGKEGVSGDTPIPDGGFVLSSGNSLYASYMKKLKKGDTAERITKDSTYFFRKITDVSYGKKADDRYITVYSGMSKTPSLENALEISVDKNGYILSASEKGGTAVPEGGWVISAVGYKKQELSRFYKIGQRVFFMEDISAFALFGNADLCADEITDKITELENTLEKAKESLYAIDLEYAYGLLDEAKKALANAPSDPASLFIAKEKAEEVEKASVPSFLVQDRAAWVVHYETDADDVKHIVKYAHSLGLNRLILAPFRDTYALYNTQNEHLSRHPDLEEGVDMLQIYIDECHALGMQVYFMYGCFCTAYPSVSYPETHFVNYFGDKLLISKAGRDVAYFYDTPSYTLNPYDREVRQWTLEVIREVCESYDIDGVQLDYIRFPLPTYYGESNYEDHGYNEDITKAFMSKYGTSVNPKDMPITHSLWDEWCQFRCDIVTSFAAEASKVVKEYDLPFTCTCFAGSGDREKYVFQDVKAWAEKGIADAIYPMIYSATLEGQMQYGDDTKAIIGENCGLVLGIGTYDGETNDVIRDQVMYSYNLGSEGNSVFALEYIQNFGFDTLYADCLYRNPAVTTDMYGKTVTGYCQQLTFMVEKVYKYCDPDVDYTGLLNEIKAVSDAYGDFDPAGKTAAEKAQYLSSVINALKDLKSKCPEYAAENFSFHVDTAVSSLTRLRNTLK